MVLIRNVKAFVVDLQLNPSESLIFAIVTAHAGQLVQEIEMVDYTDIVVSVFLPHFDPSAIPILDTLTSKLRPGVVVCERQPQLTVTLVTPVTLFAPVSRDARATLFWTGILILDWLSVCLIA